MRQRSACLLVPLFLLSLHPLAGQTACDTAAANAILIRAVEVFAGEQFPDAPALALSALPLVGSCGSAVDRSVALFRQAAAWQTELELFDAAAGNLEKALARSETDAQKSRVLGDWVDLDIAARQYERAAAHLQSARTHHPSGHLALQLSVQEVALLTATDRVPEALAIVAALNGRFAPDAAVEPSLRLRFYIARVAALIAVSRHAAVDSLAAGYLAYAEQVRSQHPGPHLELLLLVAGSASAGSAFRKKAPAYHERLQEALAAAPPAVRARWTAAVTVEQIRLYSLQMQNPRAVATHGKALEQLSAERLSHGLLEAAAHQHLATAYLFMGMNEKALEAGRASNARLSRLPAPGARMIAWNNIRIGQCYQSMGELDLAVEYMEKAVRDVTKDLAPENQLPYLSPLIGLYGQKKDTLKTRLFIERYAAALKASASASDVEKFLLGKYWFNFHKNFGSLDTGITFAEAALRDYGPRVSNFYSKELELRLSHAYLDRGDFKKSFDLANRLATYFEQRRAKLGEAYATEHYSWMLAVSALSAWRLYEATGDTSAHRIAQEQCEKSENALYALRRKKKGNQDVQWITDAYLYAGLVNLRYHFYRESGDYRHVQRAFGIGEMSRMARFQEYLNTARALQFGDLAPEASRQERALLDRIAAIKSEQDKLYLEDGPIKDSVANALAGELTGLQRRHDQLVSTFEVQYPSYHRLKYDLSHIDLETVQHSVLKPGETLLCYYYYFDEIGIMAVRRDSVLFRQVRISDGDLEQIDSLIRYFSHFPRLQNLPEAQYVQHQANLTRALHHCYAQLVAPVAAFLTADVLIQPCDVLVYLPFEALLSRPADQLSRPAAWPFLANDKNISYIQTATVFDAVQRRKPLREPSVELYAFAPFFDGDTASFSGVDYSRRFKGDFYSALPHSGEEAVAVAKLLAGKAFVGKDASAARFTESVSGCRILHAATHASGGNGSIEPSFLALQAEQTTTQPSLLFTDQIYQLQMNADLVTLSACESGLGEYSPNEGLEGLTRAFVCAGARNIVASLWSVSDVSTKRLMIGFYREIKKGVAYNRALANAKRAFIRENRAYAHPYYWAGFVLNGR